MRIGLYGIGGVYNFGCEAIVRGAYKVIQGLYPGADIVYFSYDPEYDRKILADLDIEVFTIKMNRSFTKRLINKGRQVIGYNKRSFLINFDEMMNRVDSIWSIGGDIYTIPAVLRTNRKYPYYNSLVDFCDTAIANGKEVIAYGASVGPFGDYKRAISYYRDNLSRYTKIVCREYATLKYLNSIGLYNTMFLPDPALQIRGNEGYSEKKYVGINLSPLSLNEIYGNHDEASIIKFAGMLDKIYLRFKTDLMLIPHVISKDENDDDLRFLMAVKEHVSIELQKHIILADYSGGFIGIKSQLRKCYFVLAARMHCAINAIDENIPAIFLSYSQKSIGMCNYIYQSDKWLLDIRDVEESGLQKITDMMNQKDQVSAYLSERNNVINSYFNEHYMDILK